MTAAGIPLVQAFAAAVGHQQAGRLQEASRMLRTILAAVPDHPESLYLLGLVESEAKNFAAAARHIERAIEVAPGNPIFYHHIYEIYRRLHRYDDAVAAACRALEAFPAETLILVNLSAIHRDRLDLAAAISCAEQAIARQPDLAEAHFALAEACLLAGHLPRGLAEYEWRWGIASAGRMMTPTGLALWDGSPMPETRLLLVADQGFGDVIMFARFLPWVAQRCPDIAMVCAAELRRVIARIAPDVVLFDRWSEPPCAVYCPLSSLPHRYGVTLAAIPADIPYLSAQPLPALAGLIPPGQLRIGIAWSGAADHHNDFNRSTSLAAFAPLAALEGVTLVSLQKGAARGEIAQCAGPAALLDGGAMVDDFLDTAALIAALDLVIAVDTSVVHVAGAMGKPVWILLAYAPDWRWLLDRDDSPWYPTARLFRQARPGGWRELLERVADAVASEQVRLLKEKSFASFSKEALS